MMYKHTQIGWLTIFSFVPVFLAIGVAYFFSGMIWLPVLAGVFALVLLQFFALTAEVDAEGVRVKLGIGLVSKKIPFSELAAARTARNKWWYGWGVRYLGEGTWMYNVSGLDAVELEYKSGKKFRIGTDDPEGLARAIAARIS